MIRTVEQRLQEISRAMKEGEPLASTPPALVSARSPKEVLVSDSADTANGTVWNTEQLEVVSQSEVKFWAQNSKRATWLEERISDISEVWELKKSTSNDCAGICIGRAPRNDVVIIDKTISSIHARVEIVSGGVHLVDCDSSNGTYVERKKVESSSPRRLQDGDCVCFGQRVFFFFEAESLRVLLKFRLAKRLARRYRAKRRRAEHPSPSL